MAIYGLLVGIDKLQNGEQIVFMRKADLLVSVVEDLLKDSQEMCFDNFWLFGD